MENLEKEWNFLKSSEGAQMLYLAPKEYYILELWL